MTEEDGRGRQKKKLKKEKEKKKEKKNRGRKPNEDQGKMFKKLFSKSKFHLDSLLSPLSGASAH